MQKNIQTDKKTKAWTTKENIKEKKPTSSETDNLYKNCLSSQLMWWHQIRLMVNLINLHFMLKETFQMSFNNYIFKVNSSKESKKKS